MSSISDAINGANGQGSYNTNDRVKKNDMGQDAFLKLMITQMNYQNPMEPQSNAEFLSQMAQFGTVEGIRELQTSVTDMSKSLQSNRALEASSLVGRSLVIPSSQLQLINGAQTSGTVDVSEPVSDLTVSIYSNNGELVRELQLGDHVEGCADFIWDGKNEKGDLLQSGTYHMVAEGKSQGMNTSFSTNLTPKIESVSIGQNGSGIALHVAGLGTVGLEDIDRIK